MKIKSMRWGYDGGGVGCGPVEGSLIVEFVVVDENGFLNFVVGSQFMDSIKMTVSPYPMFDILMYFTCWDVNFQYELDKVEQMASEVYDYEIYHYPEDMFKSKFVNAFKLISKALEDCPSDDGEDFDGAQKFIEPYLDKDINKIEDLEFPVDDEEDDEF